MGTSPLLYYAGYKHLPYDVATMIAVKSQLRARGSSEDPNTTVQKRTWQMHSKRRLFTENVLLGIVTVSSAVFASNEEWYPEPASQLVGGETSEANCHSGIVETGEVLRRETFQIGAFVHPRQSCQLSSVLEK